MKIYRIKKDDAFVFVDEKKKEIHDEDVLEYIKMLPPIPPAYEDVVIPYTKSNSKILYYGFDTKGRKQTIYSKKWREKADKMKFKALVEFGHKYPEIIKKIDELLESKDVFSKNRMIAVMLKIITMCGFRIGQRKYEKMYNSTGMSTLRRKHIRFDAGYMHISFVGKKGVTNSCIVTDGQIVHLVREIYDKLSNDDDYMFVYDNQRVTNDNQRVVSSDDVNRWLDQFGKDFTTKYFRTFDANVKLIDTILDRFDDSIKPVGSPAAIRARKKLVKECLMKLSESINNTPAICKKSYVNGDLLNLYVEHPNKFKKEMSGKPASIAFVEFLKKIYNLQ
jgi:DNA topoisomerase-1